ncbi:hypothetical protein C7S16_0097 [Burkholderia thailandensis]|uniref:Uncharacterized protein n=1 Tax=Burkholderia thailandensis TaxID=57975 RepID=A0AAW9CZ13_BURTH|nr:hypothetical protein [Burkholderia thailandensis]MDW9256165.1 hypothetical protein [Burkholderia thailandensis]
MTPRAKNSLGQAIAPAGDHRAGEQTHDRRTTGKPPAGPIRDETRRPRGASAIAPGDVRPRGATWHPAACARNRSVPC